MRARRRVLLQLRAASLGALCAALSSCPPTEVVTLAERVPLELTAAGGWGRFLEAVPEVESRQREGRRLVRAVEVRDFETYYARLTLPLDPPRSREERRFLRASIQGARPGASSSFGYRCPKRSPATLRWWIHSSGQRSSETPLEIRAGRQRIRAPIPRRHRLGLYEAPLERDFCRGETIAKVGLGGGPRADLLLSAPVVLTRVEATTPPVILISIDTLRADSWNDSTSRPAALAEFFSDALRFRRAFSSFPTTSPSHSVIFSGLFPQEIETHPLRSVSFTTALRDAGYQTLGFVSGGFVRAPFGFGRREPGFALGFDLYLEGLHRAVRTADRDPPERGDSRSGAAAASPTSYTLGVSLERSLRWWIENPGDPAFHFIHGYDVHAYREAPRRFWDDAVEERVAGGVPPARIDSCAERVGMELGETTVVHNPKEPGGEWRQRPHGELEDCQRLLASVIYRARVRSAEWMLASYLDRLRRLGVYDDALIILTSDHGESLLDERTRNGRPWWGHQRALHNNLLIPLLIKLPGPRGQGRDVDRLVGLVDLRATIGAVLGIETGAMRGASLAGAGSSSRRDPILFSGGEEAGVVLRDGALCAWKGGDSKLRVFRGAAWRKASPDEASACERERGRADSPLRAIGLPQIPPALTEELRALGYAE